MTATATPFTMPLDELIGDSSHIHLKEMNVTIYGLTVALFHYKSSRYEGIPKPPVIAIHGGPAFTHNYIVPLKLLADSGHEVIFYDQGLCRMSVN